MLAQLTTALLFAGLFVSSHRVSQLATILSIPPQCAPAQKQCAPAQKQCTWAQKQCTWVYLDSKAVYLSLKESCSQSSTPTKGQAQCALVWTCKTPVYLQRKYCRRFDTSSVKDYYKKVKGRPSVVFCGVWQCCIYVWHCPVRSGKNSRCVGTPNSHNMTSFTVRRDGYFKHLNVEFTQCQIWVGFGLNWIYINLNQITLNNKTETMGLNSKWISLF